MNKLIALLPVALAGCSGSLALGTIASQTPAALGQIEQLKTAIATAPLAGCVGEIQQAAMLLHGLQVGTPAIPVSPEVPPIVTAPPTPGVVTPPVVVTPPTTSIPTSPTGR